MSRAKGSILEDSMSAAKVAPLLAPTGPAGAVTAFLLLFMWQTPPWLVVILCAFAGAVVPRF